MTDQTAVDFDGCNRKCRRAGAHTLVWGECEHAPEPETTVSLSRVYRAADGFPSIGFDTYTVPELAELLEPALRRVHARLGPNALAMLHRGETVSLSGGEYADLAREAAHAIVHRHDAAAAVPAGQAPAADRSGAHFSPGEGVHGSDPYYATDRATPSRRAGLRDEIAAALEAADYRMDMRRGDLADAVLPVLYREWPWLRAEAEDAAVLPASVDRAAVLEEAADAPAAECSAENHNYESGPRLCIRPAQHHGDHIDERSFHWSDTTAVYPVGDGTFRRGINRGALLRRMAAEAAPAVVSAVPGQTDDEAPSVCEGFVWIGQAFTTCDRCGQPAWEHAGEEVPAEGTGPFDTRRTVRPWKPGQADAIRARWAPQPKEAEPVVEPHCDGFPDTCPNPVTVPPAPPHHGGGIRCGCYDHEEA